MKTENSLPTDDVIPEEKAPEATKAKVKADAFVKEKADEIKAKAEEFMKWSVLRWSALPSYLFQNFLVNLLSSLVLVGVILSFIYAFGSTLEKWLFPSSQNIAKLMHDSDSLMVKTDELQKQIQRQQEQLAEIQQLRSQTTDIQEKMDGFSKNINELSDQVKNKLKDQSAQSVAQVAPGPNMIDLTEKWNTIKSHFQDGESFSKILEKISPTVLQIDSSAASLIQHILPHAQHATKTQPVLLEELTELHKTLASESLSHKNAASDAPVSWLGAIKNKFLSLIRVRSVVENSLEKDEIQALEKAVTTLKAGRLVDCIGIIKTQIKTYSSLIKKWEKDAKDRQALESSFVLLKDRLEAILGSEASKRVAS
ncbi:MAG: hypothetical protein NTX76_05180 [Alphaproteobacteria bacterium]|nr:hypothetical protein [Alphaproteobacteria bacterium]